MKQNVFIQTGKFTGDQPLATKAWEKHNAWWKHEVLFSAVKQGNNDLTDGKLHNFVHKT
jgi:hypothetical protein